MAEPFLRYAPADRNAKNRTLTTIAGGEVDRVSIRRHNQLIHLQIESTSQLNIRSGRTVVGHQTPAISFESGRRLGAIEDKLAVARVDWTSIVAVIARGNILRWSTGEGYPPAQSRLRC